MSHTLCAEAVSGRVPSSTRFCIISKPRTRARVTYLVRLGSAGSGLHETYNEALVSARVPHCVQCQCRVGQKVLYKETLDSARVPHFVCSGSVGSGPTRGETSGTSQRRGNCPQGNLIGPCRHATANARSAGPLPFNSWSFRRRPRRLLRILVPHLHGIICLGQTFCLH